MLHLQTNKVIKCQNLTKIPNTTSITKQVRALADPENMPQGLKKTYKANRIIFNSACITVVNYNDEILIMTSMVKKKIPTTKK